MSQVVEDVLRADVLAVHHAVGNEPPHAVDEHQPRDDLLAQRGEVRLLARWSKSSAGHGIASWRMWFSMLKAERSSLTNTTSNAGCFGAKSR